MLFKNYLSDFYATFKGLFFNDNFALLLKWCLLHLWDLYNWLPLGEDFVFGGFWAFLNAKIPI